MPDNRAEKGGRTMPTEMAERKGLRGWMSIRKAAFELGMSYPLMRQAVANGAIPSLQINPKRALVSVEVVNKLKLEGTFQTEQRSPQQTA